MTITLDRDLVVEMTSPPSVPQSADHQLLAALPNAVSCAQRFVRFTLERWRLHQLIDIAEAVTTELVSDAVSVTGVVVEHPTYLDLLDRHLNLIDLELHTAGFQVV